jgi:hypothetical protein
VPPALPETSMSTGGNSTASIIPGAIPQEPTATVIPASARSSSHRRFARASPQVSTRATPPVAGFGMLQG